MFNWPLFTKPKKAKKHSTKTSQPKKKQSASLPISTKQQVESTVTSLVLSKAPTRASRARSALNTPQVNDSSSNAGFPIGRALQSATSYYNRPRAEGNSTQVNGAHMKSTRIAIYEEPLAQDQSIQVCGDYDHETLRIMLSSRLPPKDRSRHQR